MINLVSLNFKNKCTSLRRNIFFSFQVKFFKLIYLINNLNYICYKMEFAG